jgi:hypothetical protein
VRSPRPPAFRHWFSLVIAPALSGALAAMVWAEQKRTRSETVKRWLITIADLVELWPALHAEDLETAYAATTPAGAVAVMVGRDIPEADVQRAVVAGLPNVLDEDWAAAARQIREFATRL